MWNDNAPILSLESILGHVLPKRLWLEFGVATGTTLRQLAALAPAQQKLYGFDWFQGLPEPWMSGGKEFEPKGKFACPQPHDFPANVEIVDGLFQDTLESFLFAHPDDYCGLVHIDCDLYSSARYVLETLGDRLHQAIVVFDEFFIEQQNIENEQRALYDFLAANPRLRAEHLGRHHPHGAVFRFYRILKRELLS